MVKKAPTPAQLRVREAFKIGRAFLAPLNGLIKNGFAEMAKRKKSLPAGLALGYTLRTAVRQEAEGPVVDPSLVLLSHGTLAGVNFPELTRHAASIVLTHRPSHSRFDADDDHIILCAYQVEKGYAFVNEKIWERGEGKVVVSLPAGFENDGFHVYLLLCNRNGAKYSRSRYLGYSTK